MNEHSGYVASEKATDVAFEPMDNQPDKAVVHSDGTISVPIVEGDTYIDGVRQPKRGEEIIFVQDEEPEAPVH